MPRSPCAAVAPVATVLMEVTLGSHRQADFDRFERAVRDDPGNRRLLVGRRRRRLLLKVMTRDIDAYQRLVDGLLEREIGIDRYFTYIVTSTVKEDDGRRLAALFDRSSCDHRQSLYGLQRRF